MFQRDLCLGSKNKAQGICQVPGTTICNHCGQVWWTRASQRRVDPPQLWMQLELRKVSFTVEAFTFYTIASLPLTNVSDIILCCSLRDHFTYLVALVAFLIEDIKFPKRNPELVLLFSVFAVWLNSYCITHCKMLLVKGRRYLWGAEWGQW